MKKIIIIITLFACVICAFASSAQTSKAYEDVLQAIDKWIGTIDTKDVEEVVKEDIFAMKAAIEEASEDKENGYLKLDLVSQVIGNAEFVYDGYIYNKKSILYFKLKEYVDYFEETGDSLGFKPDQEFKAIYKQYQVLIMTKEEQLDILNAFMRFLNYRYAYSNEATFLNIVMNTLYDEALEVLKQYIAILKYFKDNDIDALSQLNYSFKNSRLLSSGIRGLNDGLEEVTEFYELWKNILTKKDKEMIKNTIIKNFPESDAAVKIYVLFNKSK